MSGRLGMSGPLDAPCAGAVPKLDRWLDQARLRKVVRQELRLRVDGFREAILQGLANAGMQCLSSRAQQGAVGGVLYQRVLEEIGGLRCDTATEQQPGFDESVE